MEQQIYRVGDPVKRVTSKRPSNYYGAFGLVRPGESAVVTDEEAAKLSAEEFDIAETEDGTLFDIPLTDTPPSVVTKPAKKARTRK